MIRSTKPAPGKGASTPIVVVLTRLAIDPASDSDLRQLAPGENPRFLDDEWLTERIQQMFNLSLRSLERQSLYPDLHLIAVDYRVLDQAHRNMAGRLPPFSEVLELKSGQSFNERVRERLSEFPPDQVTVRLDSDDCLAPEFLAQVAKHVLVGNALNFPHGIQWISSRGYVVHRLILSNPTIAYRSRDRVHVFDFGRHRMVYKTVPTRNRWTLAPMYLKYSHRLSHATHQNGGFSVLRPGRALGRFGIRPEYIGQRVRWSLISLGELTLFYFRRKAPKLDWVIYQFIRKWRRGAR